MMHAIKKAFAGEEVFLPGEPWFQGDHALFLMNGRPALALTSERVNELLAEIVHTEKDVPALVDYPQVARTALALHRLLGAL
jgi:aminopeptidase YwaD